jgi:hypothetical protein
MSEATPEPPPSEREPVESTVGDTAPEAEKTVSPTPTGTRTTRREIHSTTSRSTTESHETSETVEDVPLVPPLYSAPQPGAEPWPVG